MTLGKIKQRFQGVVSGGLLLGFESGRDADGFCVSVDLFAPTEDSQKPEARFTLWSGKKEMFSQTIELDLADELQFVVNGEAINLEYVIATESLLNRAFRRRGLTQHLVPAG